MMETNLVERELNESNPDDENHRESLNFEEADRPSEFSEGSSAGIRMNPREVKEMQRQPKLWAVGGGKGGVGKSLICANFSISLARRGRKVVAIDLDLGGSNLHTCMGVNPPQIGFGDWVFGRINDLEKLKIKTSEPNLEIISGSQDPLKVMSAMTQRQSDLIEQIKAMDADDIILDLGAGTADYTIDMFNTADEGILSILPEPTSVENAYRFIRAAFFRRLHGATESPDIREIIDAGTDPKNPIGIRTPADLLLIVDRLDPFEGEKLKVAIRNFSPHIVINQVRSQVDIDVGRAVCSVCRRYFGIEVRYAGYLDYDNAVWKAVRSRRALLQEFPHSPLATKMDRLTKTLLGEEKGYFP